MAETDSRVLEFLEEGLFLYGVGKVQDAIQRWRKVLELDPRNERALDYIESAGGDVSQWRRPGGGQQPPPPQAPPAQTFQQPQFDSTTQPMSAPPPMTPPRPSPPPVQSAPVNPLFAGFGAPSPAMQPSAPPRMPPPPAFPPGFGAQPMSPVMPTPPPMTIPVVPPPQSFPTPPPVQAFQPPTPPPPQAFSTPPPQQQQAPTAAESRDELLRQAATLFRSQQAEGALELLERIAREYPPVDDTLRGYLDATRTAVLNGLRGQWTMDKVPRPRMAAGSVMQMQLSPEAGFLLSRIDGMSTLEDILSIAGLEELVFLRAFSVLVRSGVVEL